jgi:serine/threonine protein kinase
MLKLLGEGGFGKVFLAQHKQTGTKYAIKIIKTENIGSVYDIDCIFVEAEILKSLNHQNIVKVYKCLTMKNMEVVIIMEYLEGGDLFKYVTGLTSLDERTARQLTRQIVRGILYCHNNNLTHRDLKLENILLVNSEEKKIKIIDFGIAGAISNMKWEQLDVGSLSYMAPECFIAQKDYKFDGKIDIWAIGIILYAMLCGELPFKGHSASETI